MNGINAENPALDFQPSPGTISVCHQLSGLNELTDHFAAKIPDMTVCKKLFVKEIEQSYSKTDH